MATTVNFALTDSNGQLTGKPLAHVQGLAKTAASAVEAKIPDVSGFALKSAIPDASTLATKTEVSTLSNTVSSKVDAAAVDSKVSAAKNDLTSTFDTKLAASEAKILASVGTGTAATSTATRLVPLALTLGQGDQTYSKLSATHRVPLKFNAQITRWRLHIRNINPRTGTVVTGAVPFDGLWLGKHDVAGGIGKYSEAPVKISEAFSTPADGSEYVTAWFTNNIGGNVERLLEFQYTNAPSAPMYLAGGSYYAGVGNGGNQAYASSYSVNSTPFDLWIEAETPATTKVYTVFGDSLSVGIGSKRPVAQSALSQYAQKNGGLPVHYAASGDTMADWISKGETSYKLSRWDGVGKGDVLLHSMASNDIFAGSTLSAIQTRFTQTLDMLKKRVKDGADVYASTIFPRDGVTGAMEDVRRQYNTWLKSQKGVTVKNVFDLSAVVSADDETLRTEYGSEGTPDGTHVNATAYAAIADALNLPVATAAVAGGSNVQIVDNGNGTATITL